MNTDTRSDEELNRVIAEWCGWKFVPSRDIYICGQLQAVPEEWVDPGSESYNAPPNYCRDLNACHEAEGKLDDEQFDLFRWILWDAVKKPTINAWFRAHLSAEARQRAEALVKVIEQQKGVVCD